MENNALGVRKSAWSKEEDILLRRCIEKYGEGRWHLVPFRAGLNRCRKSCRLRWLNYLRPNIKRGYFTKDEVDLIVRLHKLLGNRWSLIAGRIPGRTANDVKSFWNTRIEKKSSLVSAERCRGKTITESNIIRPRPRTFSKIVPTQTRPNELNNLKPPNDDSNPDNQKNPPIIGSGKDANDWSSKSGENSKNKQQLQSAEQEVDECMRWWGNLLEITENENGSPFSFSGQDHPIIELPMVTSPGLHDHEANNYAINDEGMNNLDLDVDFWQLVSMDPQG